MSVLTDLYSTFPLSRRRSTRPGARAATWWRRTPRVARMRVVVGHTPPRPVDPVLLSGTCPSASGRSALHADGPVLVSAL